MNKNSLEYTWAYISPEFASALFERLRDPIEKEKLEEDHYQRLRGWGLHPKKLPSREEAIYQTVTDKLDVWALGLTFFELWCNERPVWFSQQNSQNEQEIYRQIVEQAPGFEIDIRSKMGMSENDFESSLQTPTVSGDGASSSSGHTQQSPRKNIELADLKDPLQRIKYKDYYIKVVLYNMLRVDPKERRDLGTLSEYLNDVIPPSNNVE